MDVSKLNALVKVIRAVAPKQFSIPIIENLKIKDGYLTVTNMEIMIEAKVDLKDEAIVNTVLWCNAVTSVDDFKVKINKNAYMIYNSKEKMSIPGGGDRMNEFPNSMVKKDVKSVEVGTITKKEISKLLIASKFCNTEDTLRPHLMSVSYHDKIISTDANRGFYHTPEKTLDKEVLFPVSVCRVLDLLEGEFMVAIHGDKIVSLTADDIRLSFVLPEAKFPNFMAVIPPLFNYTAELNTRAFKEAANKARLYGNQTSHQVVISIDGDNISMEAEDVDFNTSYKSDLEPVLVNNKLEGKSLRIGFSSNFLISIIRVIDDETLTIQINKPNNVMGINDEFILMPQRL